MHGYIHSKESFGTVDGPGIRYVLFLQGCPMRCKYCHNPDTWIQGIGEELSPESIIEEYLKNRAFYRNGGITVSGGEPLLQLEFITALFALAKEHGIHTCIDTSGITFSPGNTERLDALLSLTDLVMLDIKHIDSDRHKLLTGHGNENILAFSKHLSEKNVPICIRHVVVPGLTDDADALVRLGEFIGTLSSLKSLDVLPYHTMGVEKYKRLGIPYPLEDVADVTSSEAQKAKEHILSGIRKTRST